ncbi:MAG: aminotransferase class I/II-fold pyridoxal phosphate-dependent enzyme [Chlorobiota bacterium]|nr:MAG: aminotransferase class I/II-fold pyridoxal phosphate-dependent enzyme [Chlorobiota bacterium]
MADIFQKCYDFTRADDVKEAGYYPYFRAIEESEGPVVKIEGRDIIMAGSNNYLGLTADERVKEAAIKAIEKFGTSCSGSRYLTGTLRLHEELENDIAKFLGKEACLLFTTGYQTAQGVIPTLVSRGDYVISDKDNHACIVAGTLMAKGAFGDVARYKHGELDDLERKLKNIPIDSGKLIVTDGVFSTSGEIVDLPSFVQLAKKYNARIMVDDAHALGVIGKGGRGTASYFDLVDETDMTMGTFSKSLASIGGWVVGPERVINFIKHTSPALIFAASPTASSVAAAIESLRIIQAEPWRVDKLIENADYLREGFKRSGFNVIQSKTGVIPVIIGDDTLCFVFWRRLFDAGVFVNAFISPGVIQGMQMMRCSVMATHEKNHLDRILELFEDIGSDMGLLEKETPAISAEQTKSNVIAIDSSDITIIKVENKKQKNDFVRIVWNLYEQDNTWVPPIEMNVNRLIDTKKNPFYKHAKIQLFLAQKNGELVGRIAAIIDENHLKTHNDKTGFFGFFESINDQAVANTLINAATDWLKERGMNKIRGPVSPSMNDEVGLLVEGNEFPSAVLMPYNPIWYEILLTNCGFKAAKDLVSFKLSYPECMSERFTRVTDMLRTRGRFTIRGLNMKEYPREINRLKTIYNLAWQPNWGFVPMTDEEIQAQAYELKQIIDKDFVLFAEKDGEVAGFLLAVPDIHQSMKSGKKIPPGITNLPTAIMNIMTERKAIKQARIIIMGISPKYHGSGVDALLYREIMERTYKKGITDGEAGWVLDDNELMTRAAEMMNGKAYKRYRIFEQPIN